VEADQLTKFFGDVGGSNNRIHMLFDFMLNGRLMLALARENPEGIIDALQDTPKLPDGGQWATFLRNHDEVDLSRLTTEQRNEVFARFGPDENMQLYGRGIRRRLASMLGNDRRRIELAYALQFSLRGTPVLRYGEEIGMGEDLAQDGRNAIRTPMQWSFLPNGGFSTAPEGQLVRKVISEGEFGYQKINVTAQRHDPASLLSWFERMIHTLREAPEVGCGSCKYVDVAAPTGVLVHRSDDTTGTMVFVHNLCNKPGVVDLSSLAGEAEYPNDVLADQEYPDPGKLDEVQVAGLGYRWIRVRRHP
jgi:maltose alpha-D-glucosyltransferase/alpha-amylase